ncbi:hypothetical protein [Actinomyces ruminis]|uniref:Uncharacterized protein n=1 Tax=Actinomyces ruminis TaxID=1937003 RepID=A0ABX4M9S5_9ACTO|nr:hypothetical protein [Actinomyces ruminis]PHP52193.1 hypothetical protein BW737_011020 [Actinomyces ruminis]
MMYNTLFSAKSVVGACGVEILARILLDLAGFGFLVIALLFIALNLYGSLIFRRTRSSVGTGVPPVSPHEVVVQPRESGVAAA